MGLGVGGWGVSSRAPCSEQRLSAGDGTAAQILAGSCSSAGPAAEPPAQDPEQRVWGLLLWAGGGGLLPSSPCPARRGLPGGSGWSQQSRPGLRSLCGRPPGTRLLPAPQGRPLASKGGRWLPEPPRVVHGAGVEGLVSSGSDTQALGGGKGLRQGRRSSAAGPMFAPCYHLQLLTLCQASARAPLCPGVSLQGQRQGKCCRHHNAPS